MQNYKKKKKRKKENVLRKTVIHIEDLQCLVVAAILRFKDADFRIVFCVFICCIICFG